MRIAILTDIHGNREALSACLAHARLLGVDRLIFLGDYVGYGADPVWAVETVGELVAEGAVALLGNHDAAIDGSDAYMNTLAQAAIRWTRGQLGAESFGIEDDDRVHQLFLPGIELGEEDAGGFERRGVTGPVKDAWEAPPSNQSSPPKAGATPRPR